jgi:hypothetical protein
MNELLANPAVQAAAVPFLVGLVLAAVLAKTRIAALAICAACAAAAYFTIGFSFDTLTATRKLLLCVLASGLVVLVAGFAPATDRAGWRTGAALAAALAAIWVLLRVLAQAEGARGWWTGAAAAAFVALLVYGNTRAGADTVATDASSLWLGLGAGGLAVLGASASLGQLGIAVGAGAGGMLLLQMVYGRSLPANWAHGLPAALAAGLLGIAAVFTGQLPWYALLPLLAVPWAARALPRGERPVWLHAVLAASAALVPALLAAAAAWFTAAPPA